MTRRGPWSNRIDPSTPSFSLRLLGILSCWFLLENVKMKISIAAAFLASTASVSAWSLIWNLWFLQTRNVPFGRILRISIVRMILSWRFQSIRCFSSYSFASRKILFLNDQAFVTPSTTRRPSTAIGPVIAEGVEFDTVAREWRCKWSPDNDKASLVEAQKALDEILADVKAIGGVKSVERVSIVPATMLCFEQVWMSIFLIQNVLSFSSRLFVGGVSGIKFRIRFQMGCYKSQNTAKRYWSHKLLCALFVLFVRLGLQGHHFAWRWKLRILGRSRIQARSWLHLQTRRYRRRLFCWNSNFHGK